MARAPWSNKRIALLVVGCVLVVALLAAGVFAAVLAVGRAVKGIGNSLGIEFEQYGAIQSFEASQVASNHHIADGQLTLAMLQHAYPGTTWVSGTISASTFNLNIVSVSFGSSHVITADPFVGCEYGLTVSAADDPIIAQNHLPGIGTYYIGSLANQSSGTNPNPVCSADSAPESGWKRASSLVTHRSTIPSN